MEVILKEDVINLGSRGDVVKVAEGYGRNYLIPRKLAIEATRGNRAVIDQMKASAARRAASDRADAEALAARIGAVTLTFERKAGEKDHLFGSVTSSDIAEALAAQKLEVDRRRIQLGEPIKTVGTHTVNIRLHRDVTATVKVKVEREGGAEAAVSEEQTEAAAE